MKVENVMASHKSNPWHVSQTGNCNPHHHDHHDHDHDHDRHHGHHHDGSVSGEGNSFA